MKTKSTVFRTLLSAALLTLFIVATGCRGADQPAGNTQAPRQTAYEHILQTGVIRAGYLPYPPGSIKDPNTGKVSGIHIDALERAAAAMGLRVEWTPASGWGSIVEDVRTGRVDVIGSPVWANATRGKLADFTVPLFWSGICVYVRADDHRFDGNLPLINKSDVRLATIDGEMSDIIAQADYANAKRVSLPQNSDNSLILESVAAGRADVVFVEPYIANLYLKGKPGSLRNITPDSPVRVFPNTMMVSKNEPALKSMLDTALGELLNSGVIDRLLKQYAPEPGSFFLNAFPFRTDRAPNPAR